MDFVNTQIQIVPLSKMENVTLVLMDFIQVLKESVLNYLPTVCTVM